MENKRRALKLTRTWTIREKKTVLSILRRHGHQDVSRFETVLPKKSRLQIATFLERLKRKATVKLRTTNFSKYNALQNTHTWAPFIANICNTEPLLHDHLVAFIIPFIEKYGNRSDTVKFGDIDFRMAYGSLFQSLVGFPFPDNINDETISMIYASLDQIMQEVRTEEGPDEKILKNAINHCFDDKFQASNSKVPNVEEKWNNNVLILPEVNSFGWTLQEIELLCKKK